MACKVEKDLPVVTYQNAYASGPTSDTISPTAPVYEHRQPGENPHTIQVRQPTNFGHWHVDPRSNAANLSHHANNQIAPELPPRKTYVDASTSPMNIKKSKGGRWICLYLMMMICLILIAGVGGLVIYQMTVKKSTVQVAQTDNSEQNKFVELQNTLILKISHQSERWRAQQKDALYRLPGSTCLGQGKNIYYSSSNPFSDKRTIYPPGLNGGVDVYCDTSDGGGWIVLQYRAANDEEDFTRSWDEYVDGFGNSTGYWIGLQNLHKLTNDAAYELRIDLEDWCGNKAYAIYSNFEVAGASDNYRLNVSKFSGSLKDSFTSSSGQPFLVSTGSYCHHSRRRSGGWWYGNSYSCSTTNLNGKLYSRNELYNNYYYCSSSCNSCRKYVSTISGVYWYRFGEPSNLIKSTKMKMRLRPVAIN